VHFDLVGYDIALETPADADLNAYAAVMTWILRGVDDTRPVASVIAAAAAGPRADVAAITP
jgi:hypothetical protein